MDTLKIEESLVSWNPWWKTAEDKSFKRPKYVEPIISWLGKGKAISLVGIRKCGKTTIAKQLIHLLISQGKSADSCCYVNCEDERFFGELSNPGILEEVYQAYLALRNPSGRLLIVLDEIQNIEAWESWVRRVIEQKLDIDVIITGSSAALLFSDLATALTGRTIIINVQPLDFREYLAFMGIDAPEVIDLKESYLNLDRHIFLNHLRKYIETGGMPEIVLEKSGEKQKELARAYFSDIIFRDIVKRFGIKDSRLLEEIALYCLANSSSHISFNKIANTLKASINTVKQYVDYLEKAFMVSVVLQFSYSVKSQQHADRTRKIYSTDNGLRNLVSFRFSKDLGKMAENTAFVNIAKGKSKTYTWKGKNEVDIVRFDGKSLEAINVCYGNIAKRELAGLQEFGKMHPDAKLLLLTMDEFDESEGIQMIPLWLFLLKEQ